MTQGLLKVVATSVCRSGQHSLKVLIRFADVMNRGGKRHDLPKSLQVTIPQSQSRQHVETSGVKDRHRSRMDCL